MAQRLGGNPTQTIADIDVALVQVHWKWLHAVWCGEEMSVRLAEVEQDVLLDARFKLTHAGPTGAYPR